MDYYENSQLREPSDQYPMGIWTGDTVTVTFDIGVDNDHLGRVATPHQWACDRKNKEYPTDRIPYRLGRIWHSHRCWSRSCGPTLIVTPGNREYLILPCDKFLEGLKIGDEIVTGGGHDGVIIGGKEWFESRGRTDYVRAVKLDQSLFYRRLRPRSAKAELCWKADIHRCRFIDRPMPQESDGQLLMF